MTRGSESRIRGLLILLAECAACEASVVGWAGRERRGRVLLCYVGRSAECSGGFCSGHGVMPRE